MSKYLWLMFASNNRFLNIQLLGQETEQKTHIFSVHIFGLWPHMFAYLPINELKNLLCCCSYLLKHIIYFLNGKYFKNYFLICSAKFNKMGDNLFKDKITKYIAGYLLYYICCDRFLKLPRNHSLRFWIMSSKHLSLSKCNFFHNYHNNFDVPK